MSSRVFHLDEAAGPNHKGIFQLFRVRQFSDDKNNIPVKKEMENNISRILVKTRRWGTNVRPRDDTAVVAGKLMPVKAADTSLDPDQDS